MKKCEKCGVEIPQDYQNLLCDACYKADEERCIELQKEAENPPQVSSEPRNGILDPNYQENPEMEDKEQWQANLDLFAKQGVVLWKPTRTMYEFIKTECLNRVQQHPQFPKFIWRPKIVDVGCGIGAGSNILSQEADMVWGIDKNKKSVEFAKQAFSRIKNGIYYSAQVTFDNIDILEDTRDFMKFEVVVAIEVIEHIYDYQKFLETLIKKFDKRNNDDPTVYYFSTPNRNNKSIRKDRPYNPYHVREWTQEEMEKVLSDYFHKVEFFNSAGEPVGDRNDHTPLLAKASNPKI